jgi:hypothetical protein
MVGGSHCSVTWCFRKYNQILSRCTDSNPNLLQGSQRIGIEFKRSDVPKLTKSIQIAIDNLKLDALYIVYPGANRCHIAPGVEAVPLSALINFDVEP